MNKWLSVHRFSQPETVRFISPGIICPDGVVLCVPNRSRLILSKQVYCKSAPRRGPRLGGQNDMTYDRLRWLRERIREPGDVIVLPVVYPDDPHRRMKHRPCVLLSRVDFDTQDNATVTPFSTSSCEEKSIQVEATSTNGLALNSSFTPSVLLEIDPREILKKTIQGNVGESTLTIIRTAVEMENQE